MPRFSPSIVIDAPKDHVFALAADYTRQPEWTTLIKDVVLTSGDGKSEGTTDRTVIKIGPQKHTLEGTWTEYRPGEALAHSYTGYLKMKDRITFTPEGNGTRVQWSVDYKPPFGPLGAVMAVVMMARIFQNEIEASLDNLKAALEI
jgi:uncharacterized membrane protein